jgi:hypothetical protein
MTPDNSNISSLFGDITPNAAPPIPNVSANDVSGSTSGSVLSTITTPAVSIVPESPIVPVAPIASESPTLSVAETLSVPPVISEKIPTTPVVSEKLPSSLSEAPAPVAPQPKVLRPEESEKLRRYMEQDTIYKSMLKTVDVEKIRLRLAMRYSIVMFAIFLVAAWVVNNRVIMFGFSEFQILARIRDALFGVIAGLFSLTIWFGSDAWFRSIYMIVILRLIATAFFFAVLSALYFPLW